MASEDTDADEVKLPKAVASTKAVEVAPVEKDPNRWVRRAVFMGVLVVGWLFIGWQNRFYLSAPTVIVGIGYLALLSTIYALWRTSVTAVAIDDLDDGADSTWGRPAGRSGELQREKRTLLKAIREAEFDLEMGKLSAKDAEDMIAVYRLRAIETIKEIDQLEGTGGGSVREQIEREVKARLELDVKAGKAKADAQADAARDKKRKDKKPKADAFIDVVKAKAEEELARAQESDSHEPPSDHDSTVAVSEEKAAR